MSGHKFSVPLSEYVPTKEAWAKWMVGWKGTCSSTPPVLPFLLVPGDSMASTPSEMMTGAILKATLPETLRGLSDRYALHVCGLVCVYVCVCVCVVCVCVCV